MILFRQVVLGDIPLGTTLFNFKYIIPY